MSVNTKKDAIERYSKIVVTENKNRIISELQNDARTQLSKMKFPTLKTEEWKYTNLKELLNSEFVHFSESSKIEIDSEAVEKVASNSFENYLIVIENGVLNRKLSDIEKLNNEINVTTISEAMETHSELVEKYLSKIALDKTAFDYLNLANFVDGLFIQIPNGKVLDKPIQILNISHSKGNKLFTPSRNLFVVGKNSEVVVIQKYVGLLAERYFNNISTEIFIDENGKLDIYKIELESKDSFHIDKTDVLQHRNSNFNHSNFAFGGKLVRTDVNTELNGENIEVELNGLYIGSDKQHIDNNTFINHAKPHSTSNELYKGILDDNSHGVFSGKILVERDAQQTNAYQNNNTILLSDNAKVDTKPQLEIYADDVKCTHGATVGQLDESAMFYILSRGIPREKAKQMLINAFAESVVTEVKIEALREEINNSIFERLK